MTKSESAKIALDAAMAEFESIDVTKRYFWANVESLRQHLQGELNRFKTAMHNPMGRPLDLGNTLSTPLGEVRCQTQLANSKTMIDFLVESEEFKTADSIIAPAVANVRAAEEKLREAIDEENEVEQARLNALEAAKLAAIEKLERDFARPEEPAPPEPKPLVRGRNLKPTIATEAEAVPEEMDLAEPSFT